MADFQFFHDFIFTNGSAKNSGTTMGPPHIWFFERLNFTNDQHLWISQNLHTLKKHPTIWHHMVSNFCGVKIFVDFMGSSYPKKLLNFIYIQTIAMPWKYNPIQLSKLPKPQKFRPSKVTTHMVFLLYVWMTNFPVKILCHMVTSCVCSYVLQLYIHMHYNSTY